METVTIAADGRYILILLLYYWHGNIRAVYFLTRWKETGAGKVSKIKSCHAMGDWQTSFKFQLQRPVVCTCMVGGVTQHQHYTRKVRDPKYISYFRSWNCKAAYQYGKNCLQESEITYSFQTTSFIKIFSFLNSKYYSAIITMPSQK